MAWRQSENSATCSSLPSRMETRNAPGYTSKQQIKKNADRAVGRALDVVPATQITSNHANAMETPLAQDIPQYRYKTRL